MNKPTFSWDAESGIATCILKYKNEVFYGIAACSPEDLDMMSEKTGCEIALYKAELKYYKYLRDCELKPSINTLNHLVSTMITSSKYNPKSYEARRIRREYHLLKNDLDVVNQMIAVKKQELKEYIQKKDEFYKHIRKNRNKAENN